MRRYPPSTIHKYLDLPSTQRIQTHISHRQNTILPLLTQVQAPYPLLTYTTHSPPTPPTPPQPTHRHTSNTPPVPTDSSHPLTSPALKLKHPMYITSQQCEPIGCTRQEVGSLHSLETTLHSQQQTYLRLLIHTTQNFKWSRYTLTTLNISQ